MSITCFNQLLDPPKQFQADRDGDGSAQLAWVDGLFAAMGCELGGMFHYETLTNMRVYHAHMLHGAGIFTYIWVISRGNVR